MTVTVVTRSLFRHGQNRIRFSRFFEFFFRPRVAGVFVRVILNRELAISRLKLLLAGVFRNAQNFVIIAFCHNECEIRLLIIK